MTGLFRQNTPEPRGKNLREFIKAFVRRQTGG